jgi:hypothetical protein
MQGAQTSNNIIQKTLAFRPVWSATVGCFGGAAALRDPPRRPDGLRGASVVQPDGCAEPKESPNEKISKEASWSKFCWIVR